MEEKKIKLGKEKISELGGELGDFMINNINRLHPHMRSLSRTLLRL